MLSPNKNNVRQDTDDLDPNWQLAEVKAREMRLVQQLVDNWKSEGIIKALLTNEESNYNNGAGLRRLALHCFDLGCPHDEIFDSKARSVVTNGRINTENDVGLTQLLYSLIDDSVQYRDDNPKRYQLIGNICPSEASINRPLIWKNFLIAIRENYQKAALMDASEGPQFGNGSEEHRRIIARNNSQFCAYNELTQNVLQPLIVEHLKKIEESAST